MSYIPKRRYARTRLLLAPLIFVAILFLQQPKQLTEKMKNKVKWGVLSTANIGMKKVLPAMQRGEWCEIAAVASRDLKRAQAAATELGIAKAYGSYDELLADPEIEAIYNPLPTHLHIDWSLRAASPGNHALCENPLSNTVAEVRGLMEARDTYRVKIGEAFMVRTHPQWMRACQL